MLNRNLGRGERHAAAVSHAPQIMTCALAILVQAKLSRKINAREIFLRKSYATLILIEVEQTAGDRVAPETGCRLDPRLFSV